MTMTDPIGDMLTRIRNGQRAGKTMVVVPASRMRSSVLDVLQREGYIRGYSWAEVRTGIAELTVDISLRNQKATKIPYRIRGIHATTGNNGYGR